MLPTYSLLQPHEDLVTYRIPHPLPDSHAFVEVGLYSWELNGVSIGEAFMAAIEGREPEDKSHEGVGLRISQSPPTHYPHSEIAADLIGSQFDVFSRGGGSGGTTFRLAEATAGELREAARRVAHYSFCYWWALDQSDDFTPGVKRKESVQERQRRLDIVESVSEDGTLVLRDGTTLTAPYTLDDCRLVPAAEWQTPTERCLADLDEFVEELREVYPDTVVRDAYRELDVSRLSPEVTKTEELEQHERFEKQLRESTAEASGIGRGLRSSLLREFDSIEDLCADIRGGSERLRSIRGVGEKKESRLIDALVAAGEWVPEEFE